MSLVRPDLSYDRSAILVFAWSQFRGPLNRPGTINRKSFGACLSYAWRLAKAARARKAEGAAEREAAEAAARATALEAFRASLTAEQRAASDAWLVASCSTDGRNVPNHRTGA